MTGRDVVDAGGFRSVGETKRRAWGSPGIATRAEGGTLRTEGDLDGAGAPTARVRPAWRTRASRVFR